MKKKVKKLKKKKQVKKIIVNKKIKRRLKVKRRKTNISKVKLKKAKLKRKLKKSTKIKKKPVRAKTKGKIKSKQKPKQGSKPEKPQIIRKRKFEFTKMVASGNDFIVYDNRRTGLKNGSELAVSLCKRTEGIGADGLIFIEKSRKADFKMRIFNPDGSEAEMCGNGLRCAALYKGKKNVTVETLAGFLKAELRDERIRVNITAPKDVRINISLDINGRVYQVNFINTGVPHAVYLVENLEAINVKLLGRLIRYHRDFQPEGTNVDFIKGIDTDNLRIRTYERGVEAETMACGTGAVASALIYHYKFLATTGRQMLKVHTKGGEILNVYFDYNNRQYENVWLEGKARVAYKGDCYV